MKLTNEKYVVMMEDDMGPLADRRWAMSHLVGDLIALQTGEGENYGNLVWMERDEAIAFADALKAQAERISTSFVEEA